MEKVKTKRCLRCRSRRGRFLTCMGWVTEASVVQLFVCARSWLGRQQWTIDRFLDNRRIGDMDEMTTKRARRCNFARDPAQTCFSEAAQRNQRHFTGGSANLLWLLQARLSSGSPPAQPTQYGHLQCCGGHPSPYEHEVAYSGNRNFLFTTPKKRSDITAALSLEAVEVASSSQILGLTNTAMELSSPSPSKEAFNGRKHSRWQGLKPCVTSIFGMLFIHEIIAPLGLHRLDCITSSPSGAGHRAAAETQHHSLFQGAKPL